MPCITPNHDFAFRIDEDFFNLLISKFYNGRPQLFRRISKGMQGVTPFDSALPPFVIGETGHAIEYELRMLAPPDGKFIDLHPARDERTGLISNSGEFLFKCGLLIRLWDPKVNRRWEVDFPATVTCAPLANGQNEQIEARAVIISGPVPPAFQAAINYVVLHLIQSAFKRLTVPGNFLLGPPANMLIRIEGLPVADNIFEVDAGFVF